MSGLSTNSKSCLASSCSDKLKQTCSDSLNRLMNIWTVIYGPNDANFNKRLETLETNLERFWEERIEEMENSKRSLADSIESLGKQALALEKVLGISSGLSKNIEDTPLADLEDQLWKLLESYNEIKVKRMRDYDVLKEKEKDLCLILEENCQLTDPISKNIIEYSHANDLNVPSQEEISKAAERVAYLEGLMEQLNKDFLAAKAEFRQLLEECEILPLNKIERFASQEMGEVDFACTKNNYDKLVAQVEKYRSIKAASELQANNLRDEVSKLWIKMLKDQRELQEFLDQHEGCKKQVITKLGQKLKELQIERKENLKELILQQRSLLDDLWTECKYTDAQRNEFQAYGTNCFTEKVLEEHEQEVARLQVHLNTYRRIYQLARKYFELWERLLHLEDLAKQSDRLFKNRGGQLLLEEKERKLVQKKLPEIKEKLVNLVHEYREVEGHDFLYLGASLLNTLDEMEEERQASKENEKMQRRAANVENMKADSRLGTRPVTVGCKRKLLTPQHPNVSTKFIKVSSTSSTHSLASSKSTSQERFKTPRNEVACQRKRRGSPELTFAVPRTPSKTPTPATPANGSPTYESFQEHFGTVCKEEYLSSTIDPTAKCPIPTTTRSGKIKTASEKKTPHKSSKTPYKTPTKIPFRIATGSKIPSIVPPISPRITPKSCNRTKLPIIF